MSIQWHLFTKADSNAAAEKKVESVVRELGVPKAESNIFSESTNRFEATFTTQVSEDAWASLVVQALALAQKIGRAWHLSGGIEKELDAWSNESALSDISSIHIMLFADEDDS